MAKRFRAKFVSITVWCEKLEKEITMSEDEVHFDGDYHSCELCGSHGNVAVSFHCECKEHHILKLNEW